MRYMAKVLKAALEKKFPEAAEKDVLKVNGNDFSLILIAYSLLTIFKILRSNCCDFS